MSPSARGFAEFRTAATMASLLLCLCGCQAFACGPGFSTPSEAARDLAAFNSVLAANPEFKGLRATAVHGHEVDVVDSNIRRDAPSLDEGPHGDLKYNVAGGISDKLRSAWQETFAMLHPHAFYRNIVDIEVRDRKGGFVIGISQQECLMP